MTRVKKRGQTVCLVITCCVKMIWLKFPRYQTKLTLNHQVKLLFNSIFYNNPSFFFLIKTQLQPNWHLWKKSQQDSLQKTDSSADLLHRVSFIFIYLCIVFFSCRLFVVVLTGNKHRGWKSQQLQWWTSTRGKQREPFIRTNFHLWEYLEYHHIMSEKTPVSDPLFLAQTGNSE